MKRAVRLALLAAVAIPVLAWHAERVVERRLQDRLVRDAAVRGWGLSIGRTAFSWWRPLRLTDVRVLRSGVELAVGEVEVDWTWRGGLDRRAHLRAIALREVALQAAGATVRLPATSWVVERWTGSAAREEIVMHAREGDGRLGVLLEETPQQKQVALDMERVDLRRVAVSGNAPALQAGVWTGRGHVRARGEAVESGGWVQVDGLAVGLPGETETGAASRLRASWQAKQENGQLDLTARGAFGGAEADLAGSVLTAGPQPVIEGRVEARVELARALRVSGLDLPPPMTPPWRDLGVARLEAAGSMRVGDPASLDLNPVLVYTPPQQRVTAFDAYRGPFRFEAEDGSVVEVREGLPSFIAYEQVPQLFVRALVISEDAGFWGHPGIDVAEIPVAWATNAERGKAAFGASTITQQLVKNLFLSRTKTYTRKLQEATLALLLDAALPKQRILEIYVNIIEWGPGVHGLKAAAQHYFGKAPADLTPREIAFLVCLIPSPVKYHQAHAVGHAGPGMDRLVDNLLAKLASVDALDAEAYEAARAEVLAFAPEGDAGDDLPP